MERRRSSKNPNFRRGLLYGLPVIVYAGLIFLLSSFPHFPEEAPPFTGYDKLAHLIEYYFFGVLICRWLVKKKHRFETGHAFFITLVIGTGYGISDEWHQSFIPGRVASIWDALFDAIGVVAAVLTYRMTMKGNSSLNNLDRFLERKFIRET
jgi:VanZ family protein